jgi:TatD DNase family protein
MFGQQLDLVKELNLPVVIHDREAHRQSLDMIQASGVRRGVFHCFSGDYDMARKCIDLGFYISIPGVVTFDKSGKIRDVVERVPLTSLLLETDAPYLTPVPNRGKRNDPPLSSIRRKRWPP